VPSPTYVRTITQDNLISSVVTASRATAKQAGFNLVGTVAESVRERIACQATTMKCGMDDGAPHSALYSINDDEM